MPRKEDNIPATLRAVAVVEALVAAERPASLAELTAASRLPKPTLYRMLAMLEAANLVAREPGARRYAPGPRLVALGRNVMLNGGLRTERHAILARLVEEIGETCNFTMLDGDAVVYLDRVEASWPLRMNLSSGSRVPLHCTASGKLLLALLPKAARTRLAAQLALTRYTDTTITDPLEMHRLRRVLHIPAGTEVVVTVTTGSADDLVLLYRWHHRFRFHNNGDGTFTFRWTTSNEPGLRHFGVNALSRGTLFDDAAPYDSQAWLFPFVVNPADASLER